MSVKALDAAQDRYGQQAVATALGNLQKAGHLRRVRGGVGEGHARLVTRTFFSRTAREDAWWTAFLADTGCDCDRPPRGKVALTAPQPTSATIPEPSPAPGSTVRTVVTPVAPVSPVAPVGPPTVIGPTAAPAAERSAAPVAPEGDGEAGGGGGGGESGGGDGDDGGGAADGGGGAPDGPERRGGRPPSAAAPADAACGGSGGMRVVGVPEQRSRAYELLVQLGHRDHRLVLSAAECAALEDGVAQWLALGMTPAQVVQALSAGLPEEVHAPAGLLRRRLRDKAPPPPAPATPQAAAPHRWWAECAECGRPGRPQALPGGLCRDCRGAPEPTPPGPVARESVRGHVERIRAACRERRGGFAAAPAGAAG
ncbi:MarR family transcriptional regulator [Streptomyces sp. NPDC059740]|uniref:MarR family transcriptional regulator n=1 Tax=Streptomyces sp. NPDC059740 TaxID=3346926 RepID=UPI00366498FB